MLTVVSLKDSLKWDEIVKSFKSHDIYYHAGYSKACKLMEEGEPTLFYFEYENMQAINVALIRDISNAKYFKGKLPEKQYFDMSTPYGYGGLLTEGEVTREGIQKLFEEFSTYCEEYGIISEFIRFHPLFNNQADLKDIYDVSYNRETIYMDLENEETIWNNMKSTSRNRIRKIQNLNVSVERDSSKQSMDKFIELYYKTMDKNQANDSYYFSKDYFKQLIRLEDSCEIFNVFLDDEIIASMIVLVGKEYIHYHLGATNPDYYSYSPNNILFYEVAKWGAKNNFKAFHLGGGYTSANDGLFRFKNTLNKNGETSFYIGKKIWNLDIYNMLLDMRRNDDDFDVVSNFFPKYRG